MMKVLAIAFALLVATVVAAAPVELTAENYESITSQDGKVVLVKVYADWCGHCKSLVGPYAEVADNFADNENVVIAKFNAPEHEDYARNVLKIRSFPTIFVYRHGLKTDFEGERNKAALIAAVEKAL
jgi:protein disulfide-isomerase-like protein